jgi:hypothetical protein
MKTLLNKYDEYKCYNQKSLLQKYKDDEKKKKNTVILWVIINNNIKIA